MSALTTGQIKTRIERTCDSIWRMGDRDECSIKHVAHSLAAISYGKTWEDGVDYSTPWGDPVTYLPLTDEFIQWGPQRLAVSEKQLREKWAKVEALRDEVGLPAFNAACSTTKFAGLWSSYCEMYWKEAS